MNKVIAGLEKQYELLSIAAHEAYAEGDLATWREAYGQMAAIAKELNITK